MTTQQKEHFLADFDKLEKESSDTPSWLRNFRRSALDHFLAMPFPTTHDEEWRFTNVAPVLKNVFPASVLARVSTQDYNGFKKFLWNDESRLVFVDGSYVEELSVLPSENIRVEDLQTAIRSESLHQYLNSTWFDGVFTAWNAAFLQNGAIVEIPAGTVLQRPVHIVFLSTRELTIHPRIYVVAGERSEATIIESYRSVSGIRYFTNAVTQVVLQEGAVLHHIKVQSESQSGFHIATMQVEQDRDSSYSSLLVTLGAELSRNDLNVRLNGVGAECNLNGLYLISGKQHADHHTSIDHIRAHATSQELYKGILNGESRAVFNGKIIVRKDAQGTDARQTNKNLLLSEGTRINTKPQLEILADDVKCNHGATIGHLEDESLFYLRSRGISDRDARTMLMYGFVNDVTSRLKQDTVRQKVEEAVLARLQAFSEGLEAA